MTVNIELEPSIDAGDTDWAAQAEDQRTRRAGNFARLKAKVEELLLKVPVQKIKAGSTTYSPDANGLVTLPSGVVAPATTTAERDAIASPTIGQLIYNTTTGRLEVYSPNGWVGVGTVQIDVFTASGTWTKPAGTKMCLVIAFGGGGSGSALAPNTGTQTAFGGGSGARAQALFAAALLPASVAVTVGPGATGPTATGPSNTINGGTVGSPSSFGEFVLAGGGGAFINNSTGNTRGFVGTNLIKGQAQGNSMVGGSDVGQIGSVYGTGVIGGGTEGGPANLGLGPGGGGGSTSGSGAGAGAGGSALGARGRRLDGSTTVVAANEGVYGNGQGLSRSGTGVGGDGAPGTYSAGLSAVGVDGYIPGGGGGGCSVANSSSTTNTAKAGNGARGEVIVVSIF